MKIARELIASDKLKPLFDDPLKLPFGRQFTDHMFTMEYSPDGHWGQARIKPYGPLVLDPSANVFHYSQEIFEGQKAYLSPKGDILMFRPEENARRLNRSLRRMCMPEIPEAVVLEAECELLKVEKRWVPAKKGASLYIRPTVIGTEAALGIKPSSSYLFYIILSPVGPYFKEGFNPVSLWVSDTYSRAGSGGTGEAKTGGNYAGSLLATREATQKGYSQVLWLDAGEHRYVEEVGAMNIFFVIDGKLVTPALGGTILHGITRKSVLELAAELGIASEERRITIEEVVDGIDSGKVTEVFGAGTAAVISPVGKIAFRGVDRVVNGNQTGPWAQKFFAALTGIQYGELADRRGWVYTVQ
ncbi:MAG: branched-chain amino acid aminotransferase [Acidobacteria bacterium]|jgi:branched-chain amino acid aminotransferase|nr:branched-chain amino acid aminotransferase [Acidobacteriota bacterium]